MEGVEKARSQRGLFQTRFSVRLSVGRREGWGETLHSRGLQRTVRSWETDNFQTYIKSISIKTLLRWDDRRRQKAWDVLILTNYRRNMFPLFCLKVREEDFGVFIRIDWLQDNFMMTKCLGAIKCWPSGLRRQNIYMKTIKMVRTVRVFSGAPVSPHFPSAAQTFRHFFSQGIGDPASSFIPSDFVITVITYNKSLSWSSLSWAQQRIIKCSHIVITEVEEPWIIGHWH